MIPLKRFVLAEKQHEGGEDDKRDYLLNHFQLPQRERPPVFDAADPVGRNLKTVFEQSDAPTQQRDGCERYPYNASVIKALEQTSSRMVRIPRGIGFGFLSGAKIRKNTIPCFSRGKTLHRLPTCVAEFPESDGQAEIK